MGSRANVCASQYEVWLSSLVENLKCQVPLFVWSTRADIVDIWAVDLIAPDLCFYVQEMAT